jgi:hypothetical protein
MPFITPVISSIIYDSISNLFLPHKLPVYLHNLSSSFHFIELVPQTNYIIIIIIIITSIYFSWQVNNLNWHVGCLECSVCRVSLRQHNSCYIKNKEIFCKLDYFR